MRFREYAAYRPPAPRPSVVFDDHRWLRDDTGCDILGDDPIKPNACLYGEIRTDGFADAFLLVVADDGKLEYRVERGTGSAAVDRDLALIAAHALERLIDDPAGRLANGIFRAAVWAATTSPSRTRSSGLRWAVTFDHTDAQPPAPGLAGLLPGDRHLARALARMLASPVDLAARRAFEQATDTAATRAHRPPTRLDPSTVLTPSGVVAALTSANLAAAPTGASPLTGRHPAAPLTDAGPAAPPTGANPGAAVNGAAVNGAAVNGAAVNGAAVNGADPHDGRMAMITGLAVSGRWPADGAPDRAGTPAVRWQGLDWNVLL